MLSYNPFANDVWALIVILTNLLLSNKPWSEATQSDEDYLTFRSTGRHPSLSVPSEYSFILDVFFAEESQRMNSHELLQKLV